MVRRNIASSIVVDLTLDRGTDLDFALFNYTAMEDKTTIHLNIRHSKTAPIDGNHPQVSFLSTSFSIKGGLVKHETYALAGLDG